MPYFCCRGDYNSVVVFSAGARLPGEENTNVRLWPNKDC